MITDGTSADVLSALIRDTRAGKLTWKWITEDVSEGRYAARTSEYNAHIGWDRLDDRSTEFVVTDTATGDKRVRLAGPGTGVLFTELLSLLPKRRAAGR